MDGKMTASMLAALGFLFQASCGGAPTSEADKSEADKSEADKPEVYTQLLHDAPNPPSGADRLFRGEFLFDGQSLQDTNCYYSLQMRQGGLNTWAAGWWKMPDWGAGNSNPYNYLAYWYPTESGGNANLLVLSRLNSVLWESNTWSSGSYVVVQQTDANVVMYVSGGYVPWASNQVSGYGSNICNPDGTGPDGLLGMKTRMMLNKDLWGSDLSWFPTTLLGVCGSSCATNPDCHAFTHFNGNCYLKSQNFNSTVCVDNNQDGTPDNPPCVKTLSGATSGLKMNGNYTKY